MRNKPLIGIPADVRELDPHPFHMVGEKYLTAIRDGADALPFIIPALGQSLDIPDVLEKIDGLFLTGSQSNVEPHHYNGEASEPGTWHDPLRDATTLPMTELALKSGLPVLAVCRGFQELNVVMGGTLHQQVHDVPGYRNHKENPGDPLDVQYGPAHEVRLVRGGMLHGLAGSDSVQVNSLHAQAIAELASGLTVEAVAEDGLVEGFRVDEAPGFALAVQWHPEWRVMENPFSLAIFQAFGRACHEYAQRNEDLMDR